jgi:DNA-binding transcriptional MerR regulator
VERLRYILTAQRDHYLPLKVIKERLDSPGEAVLPPRAGEAATMTRAELLETAGIDGDRLDELEAFGLVRRRGRRYGQDALTVAKLVAGLSRYGVQARHLRAVKAAAERETALIEQVVAPLLHQRSPGAAGRAGQTARDIAALSIQLHAALVEAELGDAGLA